MRGWKLAAIVAAALAVVAVAQAGTRSGGGGTVNAAHNAKFGSLLVNAGGMTLYHYTAEKRGSIACTGACTQLWPPVLVKTKPIAGAGIVAGKLSTIKRPDGTKQVTYAGFALYRYAADKKAGDVKGQGVEGAWFAVTSAGTLAKAKTPVSNPTPPPTTTNGGYGGYGP